MNRTSPDKLERRTSTASGDAATLERQIGRIRQRLAAAWDRGRPAQTIHRLEDALRDRWRRLDETRYLP